MPRFLIVIALGLAAVACNAEGGDGTSTTTVEPGATSQAAVTTTTSAAATTTTTEPATAGDGSECLVGTWALDSEAFVAEMTEVFLDAGMPDADIAPLEGDFTVEFSEDGTLRAVRERWGFEIGVADSTFKVEVNGEETGSWSADDATLTVNTDVSDLIANSSIIVDGQELPMPPGLEAPGIPETIASESEYSCDGDVLAISNEGVTSTFNRT
ncbi:MAG TPA: hypothetical protein VJ948_05270 [Acidimicrobiia bacterium]|nr:hypothetical protein [Acidimicrobiia bacterium]